MIPENDLESYLKKYGGEYSSIYEDVKKCASKIWENPRLKWYTDHGVAHSERILFHLNSLCDGLVFDYRNGQPEYGLNYGEVFYLLCAVWLHDIGMQDLTDLNNLSVDQLTEDDWTEVRDRHPARSFDIIMQHAVGTDERNEFWLGLKPEPYIHYPLALICKGHGSSHFDEAVAEISQLDEDLDGKGTKIRGALLMSLLLMADEADLHQSRADFGGPNLPLSDISKLHHFRHHYIQKVAIRIPRHLETARIIKIQCAFPEPDKKWTQDLKQWIGDKLKKEAERTFSYLHIGFNGHFTWPEKPAIIEDRKAGQYEKKKMESEIRHLLRMQVEKVIDWKVCVRELKRRFVEKDGGVVCLCADEHQGIDIFLSIIECVFCAVAENGSAISVLRFDPPYEHHTFDDVLRDIDKQFGFSESSDWDDLHSKIRGKDGFHMIVLQYLDESESNIRHEIVKNAVASCRAGNEHFLLLVNTSEKDLSETFFELPKRFEKSHFYEYFKETGNSETAASAKADKMMEILKEDVIMPATNCINIAKMLDEGNL